MPTPATCSSASPCLVLAPRLLRSQPQRTGLSPRGRPGAWLARDRALVRWQACSTRLWAVDQQPHQPPPRRVLVCALMTAASHGRVPRGHTRSLNGQPDRVTACNLQVRGAPPGVSAKSAAKPVRVCVRRWWVAGGKGGARCRQHHDPRARGDVGGAPGHQNFCCQKIECALTVPAAVVGGPQSWRDAGVNI